MKTPIVITGVTRGLGLAMATKFISLGYVVIGCGRSEAAVIALRHRFGKPHYFEVLDVADADKVSQWAAKILEDFGPPKILINNAAVINAMQPLWQISREEFDGVIDVNIKGVANVLRQLLPAMVKKNAGTIVNFSSGWGRETDPGASPYCASKWAIEGLTSALAKELPSGMAAVSLNPGIIDTDMLRIAFGSEASGYARPDVWAETAAPFILALQPRDNGSALTVPGHY